MLIKVKQKKLLTALRRVTAIVKAPLITQHEALTVKAEENNKLTLTFTNLDLQVQFAINAEEVSFENENEVTMSSFGVDPNKLQGIVSNMTDDIVCIRVKDNVIATLYGDESDKLTSFTINLKAGYYIEHKFDTSELKEETPCIEIDENRLIESLPTLLECPITERDMSTGVLFYKSRDGSLSYFTTTGSVLFHYNFADTAYTFEKPNLAIIRKDFAYITSLCDCNTLKMYDCDNRVFFKIKDSVIDEGYDITVISKKLAVSSIPNPTSIISEMPIQFYVNADVLGRVMARAKLFESDKTVSCTLNIVDNKVEITSSTPVGTYVDTFEVIPISHSIDCGISFNYNFLLMAIKKQKKENFKIEIIPSKMILITTDEREMVCVIAAQNTK